MEITAKPRRRRWWRAVRVVVGAGAVLLVALLIPPALGFETHVVADDAMAGTHSRGSLVFDEQVLRTQVEVGDVLTFVPPGADAEDGTVTRRVVAIDETGIRTRGDAAAVADPWQLPRSADDLARVTFSLPVLGYPGIALDAITLPPWIPAVVALGLAVALVGLRRGSRPPDRPESLVAEVGVRSPTGATATPPLT